MFNKDRIVRFAVALTIAGAIATQIPTNGGTAIARDGYGGREGSDGRDAIRIAVAALVGYGIYATATAPTGAAAAAGAAAGAGTGAAAVPAAAAAAATTPKTIWETANETEDMKQFATAADNAGLKDELNGPGPYTAFIPNSAAFATLDSTKLAELMKPENKTQLASLVNGHVINGSYTIEQLKKEAGDAGAAGKPYPTLGGGTATITYNNGTLQINGVTITESDIPASNGVIHPIGQVLAAATPAP